MGKWELRNSNLELNTNKTKIIKTSQEYVDLFLKKFTYFFYNSNVIYSLCLNPKSEISITRLEQLLFNDKNIEDIFSYKVIEMEKVQFQLEYLTDKQFLYDKVHNTLAIASVMSEYLQDTIDISCQDDYGDNEKYNELLEVKYTFLVAVLKNIHKIFKKHLDCDEEYEQKYRILFEELNKKSISWGSPPASSFVKTIFINNKLVDNPDFRNRLMWLIFQQESKIEGPGCPKILTK